MLHHLSLVAAEPAAQPMLVATLQQIDPQHPAVLLVAQAYHNLGLRMELETMPLERIRYQLARGTLVDANLAAAATLNQILPDLIRLEVPVYQLEIALFVRKEQPLAADWQQLRDTKLVYLQGMNSVELLMGQHQIQQASAVLSMSQALQALAKGRYDGAVLPRAEAEVVLKQLKINQVVASTPILETIPMYHYLHRKHQQLVGPLTTQLKLLTGAQQSIP